MRAVADPSVPNTIAARIGVRSTGSSRAEELEISCFLIETLTLAMVGWPAALQSEIPRLSATDRVNRPSFSGGSVR